MNIIIFFVSFFVIIFLSSIRTYHMKVRNLNFFSNITQRGDFFINNVIDRIIYRINRWRKIIDIFFFEFIPSYFYEILVKMKDIVSKYYYQNGDKFRGKRALKSDGSVSFFLNRLSE